MKPRALLVALAPLAISAVAALIVVLAQANGTVIVRIPLTTILLTAGAVVTVVWLVIRLWTQRTGRAYDRGRDDGTRAERESHRRFLARLDHEIKNPVTAIRTALAAEHAAPHTGAPSASPHLAVAAAQADRLAGLVGELRALASLETRDIERADVDIAALVVEEVDALRDELVARDTVREIGVHLPHTPWPLAHVRGDRDLLAVALRNLLVNAAKYSDVGARIEVRGSDDGEHVTLEIADSGWGIAAEEQASVWDELWRGSHARRVEGSGLGLSLVSVIATRHGGDVALRSEPGRGTSVRLRLPALRR